MFDDDPISEDAVTRLGSDRYRDVLTALHDAGWPAWFSHDRGMNAALHVPLDNGRYLLVTDSVDALPWDRAHHRGWGVSLHLAPTTTAHPQPGSHPRPGIESEADGRSGPDLEPESGDAGCVGREQVGRRSRGRDDGIPLVWGCCARTGTAELLALIRRVLRTAAGLHMDGADHSSHPAPDPASDPAEATHGSMRCHLMTVRRTPGAFFGVTPCLTPCCGCHDVSDRP